jgi:hypothetical protein
MREGADDGYLALLALQPTATLAGRDGHAISGICFGRESPDVPRWPTTVSASAR